MVGIILSADGDACGVQTRLSDPTARFDRERTATPVQWWWTTTQQRHTCCHVSRVCAHTGSCSQKQQQRPLLSTLKGQQRFEWQVEHQRCSRKRGEDRSHDCSHLLQGKSSFSENELILVRPCEGSQSFILHQLVWPQCEDEKFHMRGSRSTALFDLQPKHVTRDAPGGRRHRSFGVLKGTCFITPTSDVSASHTAKAANGPEMSACSQPYLLNTSSSF